MKRARFRNRKVIQLPKSMTCKNCLTAFDGSYCPQCGQESVVDPLTYKSLAKSLTLGFGSIDRGILRTLRELFTRPAQMATDYVKGKRVIYYPPFQLLFILATIFTAISFWSDNASVFSAKEQFGEFVSAEFEEIITKSVRFLQSNRGILWAISIPVQVFIFRRLYKPLREQFTWVESCFIAAYFFSQILLVQLLFLLLGLINISFVNEIVDWEFIFLLLLLSRDMKLLCGGTWRRNVIKCVFSQFVFVLFLGLSIALLFAVGIWLGIFNFSELSI